MANQGLASTQLSEARPVVQQLLRTYGLPGRIRLGNGVPRASQALGRLSTLAVGWIRLGIRPDRMTPASPQQNARHEGMHRTLKRECTQPPEPTPRTRRAQQRRFDSWRTEYTTVRPYEALGDATPVSYDTPSPRPYPRRLPPLEYPGHFEVPRVSRHGGIRSRQQWVNVSQTLEEDVGLTEIDDGE